MKPGTIVLLNGPSSSGKTSIARALQEIMEEPYVHTGIDHFLEAVPKRLFVVSDGTNPSAADGFLLVFRDGPVQTFSTADGRTGYAGAILSEVRIGSIGLRLLAGMFAAIAALARAGNNVVGDVVIYDRRVLQAAADALGECQALFVGVRCPREVAERREQERGDRGKGGAAAFYDLVHADAIYDLELDTSVLSPVECAARIKEALHMDRPRDALRQLSRVV